MGGGGGGVKRKNPSMREVVQLEPHIVGYTPGVVLKQM